MKGNKVLIGVTDIFFLGRIESVLCELPGVVAIVARPEDSLLSLYREHRPDRVVLDLQDVALDPMKSAVQIRKEVDSDGSGCELLGFYPHVRMEIRAAAEAAGVHRLLTRSAFTKLLPGILGGAGWSAVAPAGGDGAAKLSEDLE
jgi:hypothetical protein